MRSTYTKEELYRMAKEPYIGTWQAKLSRDIIDTLDKSGEYTIGDVSWRAYQLTGNQKEMRGVKSFLNKRAAKFDPVAV